MDGNMWRALAVVVPAALLTACADDSRFDDLDFDGGVEVSSASDDLGLYEQLFRCPAEITSPADAAGLAGATDDDRLGVFFDGLRRLALERLDPSCLEDCSRSPTRACVRASCTTATGDTIDYSRTREARSRDDTTGGGPDIVEIAESIDVAPGAEPAGWGRLRLTRRGMLREEADGDRELWEVEARWEGQLHPALPVDGWISAEVREWSEGGAWGAIAEWAVEGCRVAVGAGDVLLGRSGAETRVAVAGHRVEARPAGADGAGLDGWVDGRCVGEIDRSTWEVVGPCQQPGAGTSAPRVATGRPAWDDGGYPIRRCSRNHCVALKDISCLRGR